MFLLSVLSSLLTDKLTEMLLYVRSIKASDIRPSILPMRTLFHEEEPVTSIRVTPGVHDGAAGGERNILESLDFVPGTCSGVEMMDIQNVCIRVVGQLTADLVGGIR